VTPFACQLWSPNSRSSGNRIRWGLGPQTPGTKIANLGGRRGIPSGSRGDSIPALQAASDLIK